MSASTVSVIECPVTPEHVPTPLHFDGTERPSSLAENIERQISSPPPNCAICLGRCINKCFTDNCVHNFCFSCLSEWSKIKAECPLCKQPFKSIIHNVRSPEVYDEYVVIPQTPPPPVVHRFDVLLSERPRFRYRATLQVRPHESEAIQQLLLHQSGHSDHLYFDQWHSVRNQGQLFRQWVYDRHLYALPLSDITGRQRECNASFYRANPSLIHRLMPWLNREVTVLCNHALHRVDIIINVIQDLLLRSDLNSHDFRIQIEPYFLLRTNHFIHEFCVFARGPYDMYGYDRNVRYNEHEPGTPPLASPVLISSDSSEAELDDVRLIGSRRGRTEFTIETRSDSSTLILTGSFGGVGFHSNRNQSTSATTTASVSTNTSPRVTVTPTNISNTNNTVIQPRVIETLSSDTDTDECEFVLEQKPPHLRTPELVSLNSESDSDVVFVDETKNNIENQRKRKYQSPPPGVFESTIPPTLPETNPVKPKRERSDNLSLSFMCTAGPSTSFNPITIESTSTGIVKHEKKLPPIILKKSTNLSRKMKTKKNVFEDSSTCSESESSHEEYKIYRSVKRKRKSQSQRRSKREECSSSNNNNRVKKVKRNKIKNGKKKSLERIRGKKQRSNDINNLNELTKTKVRREAKPKMKSVIIKRYRELSSDETTSSSDQEAESSSSSSGSKFLNIN